MKEIIQCLRHEDGVTSIEYALIASLIVMVIFAAVTAVGGSVAALFEQVANAFP